MLHILKNIILFIFFLLFSCLSRVKGQENQIGFDLGFNQGFLKDLNFSPLNYQEGGLLYSLDYVRKQSKGKGILSIDADFSFGKLQTAASESFISEQTLFNLELSYLRKINLENQNWQFYLGGQYNSYLQILDWNDFDSFSFLATHGIGLKGFTAYKINDKNSIQSTFFLPLIQNLVRPPYNGIDEYIIENQDNILKILTHGKPAVFNKYIAFDWKVNYIYVLNSRLNLRISYLLRYQNVNEINKFIQLQNQFTTGLLLKF